jgi:hypothetical protein
MVYPKLIFSDAAGEFSAALRINLNIDETPITSRTHM